MNAFRVMADPIRFRIVEILASGEHMSGNISEVITSSHGVSRAAVSKHLAILRENGWVDYREEASARWYYLTDDVWDKLDAPVAWLKYLWERRIGHFADNDTNPRLASTWTPWSLHTKKGESR